MTSMYQGYQVLETLGQGTFGKVKLARKNNKLWAIKFTSKNKAYSTQILQKIFFKQASIVSQLNHPYIIKLQQTFKDGNYIKANDKTQKRSAIVFQYMPYNLGQIMELGGLNQTIARTLFHMMINAINYLHQKNIIHRDIKPHNILFDQFFNVKICDFGLSAKIDPQCNKPKTICGSDSFKSPQMLLKKNYNGVMNDLFALGVTLFILVFGRAPFDKATPNTGYYQFIAMNYSSKFWKGHQKKKTVSSQFKSLINSMLAFDPTHRLSISEIMSHPWMIQDVLMGDDLQIQMNKRKQQVLQRKRQIYLATKQRMNTQIGQKRINVDHVRCIGIGLKQFENLQINKRLYNKAYGRLSDKVIPKIKTFKDLKNLVQAMRGELKVQRDQQKTKTYDQFKIYLQKIIDEDQNKIIMQLKIEQAQNQEYDILKIKLVEGDQMQFIDILTSIDQVLENGRQSNEKQLINA